MRGSQTLTLSGLVFRRIFDRNHEQFTSDDSKTIPTIVVSVIISPLSAQLNDDLTTTMAGHSKWANIKFRKAAQDAKRGHRQGVGGQRVKPND